MVGSIRCKRKMISELGYYQNPGHRLPTCIAVLMWKTGLLSNLGCYLVCTNIRSRLDGLDAYHTNPKPVYCLPIVFLCFFFIIT